MTRDMALFYVKGLIVNFMFCTTCTYGILKFFFFDCTEQDNYLFPVNNCRKSCNLQKN